jgi:hypothetical protein
MGDWKDAWLSRMMSLYKKLVHDTFHIMICSEVRLC